MTLELFEQGAGVYIPALIISLFITVAAYCAYPLLYAIFQNEPITAKRYRRICYFANLIPMALFFFLADGSSGWPYVLWTSIFSSVGIKILEKKNLLEDPDDSASDQLSTPITDTNLEYSGKYQQPAVSVPTPAKSQKTKSRFCKFCGSPIDSATKKCTGCGKQYFRLPARKKSGLVPKVLVILSLLIAGLCIYRNIQYQNQIGQLTVQISSLETELASVKQTASELQDKYKEKAGKVYELSSENRQLKDTNAIMKQVYDFCDSYIVVVLDNGTRKYHKCGCYIVQFRNSAFWGYNIDAAKQQGFQPCPYCFN